MTTITRTVALGPASVVSTGKAGRPECHAPSGYSVKDYSGSNGARDRATAQILDYWHAAGVLRTSCPRNATCPVFAREGACDLGGMHVRDVVNADLSGMWFPLAGQDAVGRADRAELSHIVSAAHGGAYCACGVLPENGARNAARGDADMTTLSPSARALLAGWEGWWRANRARKASLARLAQ